jgi:hypothetical protein
VDRFREQAEIRDRGALIGGCVGLSTDHADPPAETNALSVGRRAGTSPESADHTGVQAEEPAGLSRTLVGV